ncbi:hypothetical protein F511_37772 [Dorcoceras hygrometricum]|uniref:Uncharacterized protein n=1 Tax=Dorcoceras hygrometricum TaxID=472368 RepID=A0A2Z7BSU6_9LAMI|nr:hypothetical protein F511_37772 [Dorcoceras hygrometricum]
MRATDCVTLEASGCASCAAIACSGPQHRATICASSNLRSRNHAPGSGQYRPPCAASAQVIAHAYARGKRAPPCGAAPRPMQPNTVDVIISVEANDTHAVSKNNTVAKFGVSNDELYCYKICRVNLTMNTVLSVGRNSTVSKPVGSYYHQYNNQVLLADIIILNAPLIVDF